MFVNVLYALLFLSERPEVRAVARTAVSVTLNIPFVDCVT